MQFLSPPDALILSDEQVDIWYVDLNHTMPQLTECSTILSADECARADRFKFEKHRHAFTLARGIMRQILAKYLHLDASSMVFEYGEQGKPFLNNIAFNMSHSHGVMLLAVTKSTPVGVDVEWVREKFIGDALAKVSLSEQEFLQYQQLPEASKKQSFFHVWTCKEAVIKALGQGVFFGLKDFSVNIMPKEPAKLLSIKDDSSSAWHLYHFLAKESYPGAVAWRGNVKQLCFYNY